MGVAAFRMLFIAAIWGLDLRKSSAFTGSFVDGDPEGWPSSGFFARFAGVVEGSAGLFSVCACDCTALVIPICDSYSHWSSHQDEIGDTSKILVTRYISGAVRNVGRAVFVDGIGHRTVV